MMVFVSCYIYIFPKRTIIFWPLGLVNGIFFWLNMLNGRLGSIESRRWAVYIIGSGVIDIYI